MSSCPRCGTTRAMGASSLCPACSQTRSPSRPPTTQRTAPDTARSSSHAPTRPAAKIRIVRAEGGPETAVVLERPSWVCGTRADFSIPDDPFLAPQQLRLSYAAEGGLSAEDVGGGNGVFARIHSPVALAVGGEFRVGRQRLVIETLPLAPPGGDALAWGSPDPGYRLRILQILEGGLRGSAFPIAEGETAIGREEGHITFPTDGFVSSRHAVLTVRNGHVELRDLGSSNGTFVRLSSPYRVTTAGQFLIGRQLVRVELGG